MDSCKLKKKKIKGRKGKRPKQFIHKVVDEIMKNIQTH